MSSISFEATSEEMKLVSEASKRAMILGLANERIGIEMDILATHANGCPLDLGKLVAFDDFNFAHDIGGIGRHLDRTTGRLGGCFLPRCARS